MAVGEWGGLQIRAEIPGLSDFVDGVNGIFQLVITALDIALTVMNVVKSFVSGLLNPIRQLIQQLVQLLENLILDFRRTGLYFNSDIEVISQDTTFAGIKGGYAAYERRMISRLTNREDLTRPDFSSSNTVVALFLYVGVDPSFILGLLDTSRFALFNQLFEGFARLFGLGALAGAGSLPIPVGVTSAYDQASSRISGQGTNALLWSASRLAGRDSIFLQWNIAPSPTADPTSSPAIPPNGFLVEVSTLDRGLYLGWYAPVASSTGGPAGDGTARYTTGLYIDKSTGQPVQIFGGADSIQIGEGQIWEDCFDGSGRIRDGARPVFFLTDPTSTVFIKQNPIPFRDGRYYNQRTFYIGPDAVRGQSLVGGTFSINIPFADLPLKADINLSDGTVNIDGAQPPDQVWVRVYSVSEKIQSPSDFRWNVVPYANPGDEVLLPVSSVSGREISVSDRGLASTIATAMLPTEDTDLYMSGLQASITLAILSRSDLVPQTAESAGTESATTGPSAAGYRATGLESVTTNLVPTVINNLRTYLRTPEPPLAFSENLRSKVVALAATLVESQGNLPPSLLASLRPRLERITTWKWNQTTVESDVASGVEGNPLLGWTLLDVLAYGTTTDETAPYRVPPAVAKNARSLPDVSTDDVLFNASGTLVEIRPISETSSVELAAESGLRLKYLDGTFGRSTILDVSLSAPLLYDGTDVWYVRDVVPEEIYEHAQAILQLAGVAATAPPAGTWLSWRPFAGIQPFGLTSVSQLVDLIREYAEALDTGIAGITQVILDFINALEQRIKEIQELVRRIQAYINIPLSFEIPDALLLPVVASGTNGVVSALVGAGNKPSDGPRAYSAGIVMAAGGLPSLITDILLLATSA